MAIDNFESQVNYTTKLSNFEGPLDLLLHLIKKAEIDIKDVFVSEVTTQFLQYVQNSDLQDKFSKLVHKFAFNLCRKWLDKHR